LNRRELAAAVLPEDLLVPFLLTLPAYVANPMAVLFGGRRPMDSGKLWRDGRRVLGDGKTWRGFFGGALSGIVFGAIITVILGMRSAVPGWEPIRYFLAFAAMAFGAVSGDVLGAFVKRRLGLDRGAKAPGLDQYDFLLGAFLFTAIVDPGFFTATYLTGDRTFGLLFVILITPLLHRAVNLIGFAMGKKKEPW